MREITRASTLRSDRQSYYDAGAGSGTGSSCRGTKKARLNGDEEAKPTNRAIERKFPQSQIQNTPGAPPDQAPSFSFGNTVSTVSHVPPIRAQND
jgi:hypothetical protein